MGERVWCSATKIRIDSNTIATCANLPRFQSSAEKRNLSNVRQSYCLLQQRAQQALQTYLLIGFNLGVNQTQIPRLPILPFSDLLPIKHTIKSSCKEHQQHISQIFYNFFSHASRKFFIQILKQYGPRNVCIFVILLYSQLTLDNLL